MSLPASPSDLDRYLNESESFTVNGKDGWRYTERAQQAREQKWQMVYEKYGPMDRIPRAMLAGPSNPKPPLLFYGFPYDAGFLLNYAKRHRFVVHLHKSQVERYGAEKIVYEGITREQIDSSNDFHRFIWVQLLYLVQGHVELRCGVRLLLGRPFSDKYHGSFCLFSNYNQKERACAIATVAPLREILARLEEVMNEDGHVSKVQWWYDWKNDLSLYTPL